MLWSGVDAKLLCLLGPGLGVPANGSKVCFVRAGVPGPGLPAWLAGVASLPLGFFAGVAGAGSWLLGESGHSSVRSISAGLGLLGELGPPPQRPAKQALMSGALEKLESRTGLEPKWLRMHRMGWVGLGWDGWGWIGMGWIGMDRMRIGYDKVGWVRMS